MKTKHCFVLFFLTALSTAEAQNTSPYIFFKPIYGFAANPQKLTETTVNVDGEDFTQGVYGSFGKGFSLQAGVGKMISSTFGFELGFEYLFGSKISTSFRSNIDSISGSVTERIGGFLIKPVIVIRNSGDLLTVYSKVGLAISVAASGYEDANFQFTANGQDTLILTSAREYARAKIGFTAAFGLSFRVSQAMSVFVELNGQMISLPPSKGHYTKYTQNGKDQLPNFTTSDKSWVYVKSGFLDAQSDPNKPSNRLFNPGNYSYIGLSVGLTYHF